MAPEPRYHLKFTEWNAEPYLDVTWSEVVDAVRDEIDREVSDNLDLYFGGYPSDGELQRVIERESTRAISDLSAGENRYRFHDGSYMYLEEVTS